MDEITLTYLAKNELHEVTNRQGGLNSAHVKSSLKAISHSEGMKKKEFSKEDHEEGYRLNKAAQHHATKVGEHQLATIHQTLAAHHAKAAGIDLSHEDKKDAPAPKTEDGATVKKPRMHINDAVKHINSIKDKKDPKEYVEFTADTKEKKARPYKMHFHVEQGIKGKGMGYKPEDHGLIHGHDATADGGKGGYRQVKTSNIRSIKKDGVDHDVVHDTHESEEVEEGFPTPHNKSSDALISHSNKHKSGGYQGDRDSEIDFHIGMMRAHGAFAHGNKMNKVSKEKQLEHSKLNKYHSDHLNSLYAEDDPEGKHAHESVNESLNEELNLKLAAAKTLFESIEFLPLEEKMHQDVSGFKTNVDGKEPKDAENFHVSDIPEKKKEFKGSHSYHASEKAFAASSEIGSTKNHAHAADLHRKAAKASKDAGLHDLAKHHEGIASVHDKLAASSPKSSGQQAYDRHQASKVWGNHKNPRAEAARAKGIGDGLVKARTQSKDSNPENYGSARRPAVIAAKSASSKSASAKKQKSSGFDMSAHKQRAAGLLKSIGAHVSGITTAIKSAVGGKRLATAESIEESEYVIAKKLKNGKHIFLNDKGNTTNKLSNARKHSRDETKDRGNVEVNYPGFTYHHISKFKEEIVESVQRTLIAPVCAAPETFFDRMGQKIAEGMDGEKAWQESIEEVEGEDHQERYNQLRDRAFKQGKNAENYAGHNLAAEDHQRAYDYLGKHKEKASKDWALKRATHDQQISHHKAKAKARLKASESIHPNHFPLLSEFAVEVNTVEAHEEACKAAIKVNNKDAAVYHKKAALRTAINEDTIEVASALTEAAVCSNGFSLLTQPKKFAGYHDGLVSVKKEKHKVAFDTKDKDGKRNMKEIISLVSGSIQEEVVVKSDLIPETVPVQEEPLRVEMGNKENEGKNSNPVPSKTTYSHNYGVAHFASLKAARTKKPADHKYASEMHTRAMNSAKSDSDKKYHQEKIADHNKIASATSEQVEESAHTRERDRKEEKEYSLLKKQALRASSLANRSGRKEDHSAAKDAHEKAAELASHDKAWAMHDNAAKSHAKLSEVYSGPASPQRRAASSKAGKAAAMKKYTIEPVTVKPTIPAKGQK